MTPLVIIGGGGHCRSVIDAVVRSDSYYIHGIIDDTCKAGEKRNGYYILGGISCVPTLTECSFFIAIGRNSDRQMVRDKLSHLDIKFANIFHPRCTTPSSLNNKPVGCFFGANSYVGPGCEVGDFSIINTNSCLEHDSSIGAYSHLAPGATTAGHVSIGKGTLVGINSSIRSKISIGDWTTIGMGSVVVKDIRGGSIAFGNPCKENTYGDS
jgi:sugar O-acyltransferase (sialic acid O-acetyltransferase NeuD family)